MNLAGYALKNKQVIYFFLILTVLGGIFAFEHLGKREDSPFVIKQIIFMTYYPGATADQVANQVTEVIEREIQSHPLVDFIKSESRPGFSYIKVDMYQWVAKERFQQVWDEMRRKVLNVQPKLPKEASTIMVNDDFGDVYGIYYAITADPGFSSAELEDYAQFIKQQLATSDDVAKVKLFGIQNRVVNIYISDEKLANSGITPFDIQTALSSQNQLVNTGKIESGDFDVRIDAIGTFQTIEEVKNLVITGKAGQQIRLSDIALVEKDYKDPPDTKMRMNALPAIGIGFSTRDGGNSVVAGRSIREKFAQIQHLLPVGIEMNKIYSEDEVALEANNTFITNLIESLLIVIVLILLAMGVRAGILIGSSLLFAILGTLLLMLPFGIDLHRTSLAAIIIAMGMLVDNAIVVTDNAQMKIAKGMKRRKALEEGARIPQWGLLAATIIAILSFLPLYLAPSNTAEIIKPLFAVLAVALMLSWLFALIQTTTFGDFILKQTKGSTNNKDPYDTPFYHKLTAFIEGVIKRKYLTLLAVFVLFFISIYLFRFVKQDFFPAINKPMFKVDYFLPEGSGIIPVERDIKKMEEFLMKREDVKNISITLGASPLRYYLASVSWSPRSNFANILVETSDFKSADSLLGIFQEYVKGTFPDALAIFYKFKVAPSPDAIIEAKFDGPNPEILRELAEKAKDIMRENPLATNIRDGWGIKTPKIEPVYSQNKGRMAKVTRTEMARAMQRISDGQTIGSYREGDWVMPLLLKAENRNYYNYGNIGSLPILNTYGDIIPLEQVTDSIPIEFENYYLTKFNRQLSIAAQCDPVAGIGNTELEADLMPKVEAIQLPPGYRLWWDGIYYTQQMTNDAISGKLPIAVLLILTILMLQYREWKTVSMILLMVPLVIIGITFAFLASGLFFGFFAVLGILGLVGMVIKNAIVLLDQANQEMKENGVSQYQAIVTATRSRAIPVSMAAGTTILGMAPLLPDPMFGGMAVAIMGGLFVATLLTIIVLPAFYSVFFGLKKPEVEVVKQAKDNEKASQ
ncbi:MAG: multidrug transporter AcrB [Bacteroidetes bacterium 4484_249]|nr:MAG: multidrug transporter AcrB [Bacteroidetes bacterium 4484_249]